jgi:stearoyl-CoA desaturase (delta-9 desaturase)
VHKGLFYAHYGWVILKREPGTIGPVDIKDLTKNTIVMWQHDNYPTLLFLTAYVFPITVSGLIFNDFWGGIVYASCLRLFFIQQSTFCINSLAHWIGEKPFAGHTPCDNFLVALITYGEGYHNFHHEFPKDYRNGIRWMDYDPTKWFIWLCARVNLASDLKKVSKNEIEKSRFQQSINQSINTLLTCCSLTSGVWLCRRSLRRKQE